ncbi:MAG TPA: RDD family protein [Acidimicrobiales bacterium]|nr:RDD family protein [Acidimicrobiales bacterium]
MVAPVEAHRIAPLWKRWIAGFLDSMPFVLMLLPFLLKSRRDSTSRPGRALDLAGAILSCAYEISLTATRGQTLGQIVVGIQVVDATTATVPTQRQSALRWALASIPEGLPRLLRAFVKVEEQPALAELKAEVERLEQRHRGDRQSLNEALMALYKEHNVNPARACLPYLLQVLPGLVSSCLLYGPALRGPLHQGLHDRAAGTVVIDVGNRLGGRP